MDIQNLKTFVRESMAKHPKLKEEIMEFYQLVIDEIEEGGSQSHECELAINSIKELIENNG